MKRIVLGLLAAAAMSASAFAQDISPAIIYDLGGKFDKSFNEAAYNGAEKFKSETGIEYVEFEISNDAQREQALRRFAENGRDPIVMADEAWGVDLEGEIAVIVDDVPMGASAEEARAAIRLVMLLNDVSLRGLTAGELAKGFGFFQSKPSSAFSPVAVTPDELGEAWKEGKLHLPLLVGINGKPFGRADAGRDMIFDFGQLVAHAARTRKLAAGSIVGSGTVSNKGDDGPGRPVSEGGAGYSCIVEQRMVEMLADGAARTPFLAFGDVVRIEMKDGHGHSIFGAIEQKVEKFEAR